MTTNIDTLNISLDRLQNSQNEDLIRATFDRTDNRARGEIFVKPSVATSPKRLFNLLLDKGAALPPKQTALSLLERTIAAIPSTAGHLKDGPGWHGSLPNLCFILPEETIGTAAGTVIMSERAKDDCAARGLAGTLESWRSDVAGPMARSGVAGLALLTALAAPLLRFAALPENFVINAFGNSSSGKTTGNLAAASLYGDPSKIPSWNASPTGLAQWTAANADLPLIPDDAERAAEEPAERLKKLHALTHSMTGNRSRKYAYGVSAPGQLQVVELRSLILSSSPASIEQAASRTDGDRVRWFDIAVPHGDEGGIWAPYDGDAMPPNTAEMSNSLVEATRKNHGYAGRAYLHYLVAEQVSLADRVNRYTERFVTSSAIEAGSVEGRIARKFGLLYAAGMIARKAGVLPWTKDDVLGIAQFGCRSAIDTAFGRKFEMSKAISGLRARLQDKTHYPRLPAATLSRATAVDDADGYIWKTGNRVYVRLAAFRNLLASEEAGYPGPRHIAEALRIFRDAGALLEGHGVNVTRDVRIGEARLKLLEFHLDKLGEAIKAHAESSA